MKLSEQNVLFRGCPVTDPALFRVDDANNIEEIFPAEGSAADAALLKIPRWQTVHGLCGGSAGPFGGWGRFECELLSPRRFARTYGIALRDRPAEELLTERFREIFRAALASEGQNAGAIAGTLRERIEVSALDCGWRLTDFRLGGLSHRKEGNV